MIQEFEDEDAMDAVFEEEMDSMQEEQRLRNEICEVEERLAEACDVVTDLERELSELKEQLEEFK